MKNILIDTCVVIHIIRQSSTGINCIAALKAFDANPNIIISVVTKGELESFAKQNKWGQNKLNQLTNFLNQSTYIDIENADQTLLDAYSNIDAFSKRKIADNGGNLLNGAAKKMGKNDLWIAATALAIDIPVITTDGDFDHLNGTMINVIKVV